MLDFSYDPPTRNPGKPWRWIIIDSLIIGAIAFVASLPPNRIPDINELYVAVKAFSYSFLIQLAVERGLKPYVIRRRGRGGGK